MQKIDRDTINWLENEFTAAINNNIQLIALAIQNLLQKLHGNTWWSEAKKMFRYDDKKRLENGKWETIQDLDLLALLKLIDRKYNNLKDNDLLPPHQRSIIREMMSVRSRIQGHRSAKGNSLEELDYDLGTAIKFFKLLDLPQERYQRLQDLKKNVNKYELIEKGLIQNQEPANITNNDRETAIDHLTLTFREYTKNLNLTSSQSEAVKKLDKFLINPDAHAFILKGYAGTGKTFLLGKLAQYLQEINRESVIMAPTGRAAQVISEQHNISASTIHRGIYYFEKIKEFENNKNGEKTQRYYYGLLNNDHKHGAIFIVDESSMISDNYKEGEFLRFGSGRLLSDLMEYIGFNNTDCKKKVIFVGDDAQLPPIGMPNSPALDHNYLESEYGISVSTAALTDPVRQKNDSLIIKNAHRIRKLLKSNQRNAFEFEIDNEELIKVKPEEITESYIDYIKQGNENCTIITYTNDSALSYNLEIRKKLFPEQEEITEGDKIIAVRNHYNAPINIMNGQMGKVIDLDPTPKIEHVPLNIGKDEKGERKDISVELKFRKMEIEFRDINDKPHVLPLTVLENLLSSKQASLYSRESKALYVHFANRHKNLRPGSEMFREYLKNDIYFNALQIKFAYAITCHKSQGGEWDTVFVDFQGRNKIHDEALRWSYTAVTRAEKQLYIANPLEKSLLRPTKMKNEKMPQNSNKDETDIANSNESIKIDFPAEIKPQDYHVQKIYKLVFNRLPEQAELVNALRRNYLEQYRIKYEDNEVLIKINYNSKNIISGCNISMGPAELVDDFKQRLEDMKGKDISYQPTPEENLQALSDDSNYEVFQEMLSEYDKLDISADITKKSDYHYKIKLLKNDTSCLCDYYFNSDHNITNIKPVNSNDKDSELYKQIMNIHFQ